MRIGAVSYLNTKPLIHRLSERLPEARLVLDLPSRLADRLAAGDLDVALIPVFEAFRGEKYHVVSNACIACRGPVWSVKLLSRTPLENIRSVSLDEGSRTSAALVRLWLRRSVGIEPEWSSWSIDQPLESVETDAVLIIGDRAMRDDFPDWPMQWDLGEVWHRWTGLPFVFACWVSREPGWEPVVGSALEWVRDQGLRDLEAIARRAAPEYRLSYSRCLSYLQHDLYFHLHEAQLEGLRLFRRMSIEEGWISELNELTCHGYALA